jgi:hypothetical protein
MKMFGMSWGTLTMSYFRNLAQSVTALRQKWRESISNLISFDSEKANPTLLFILSGWFLLHIEKCNENSNNRFVQDTPFLSYWGLPSYIARKAGDFQ